MLGPRPRRPYDQLAAFCTSADVAWRGLGRDLRFDDGTVYSAVDGPILVYTFPSAHLAGIEGFMVQVWGVMATGEVSAA